MVAINTGLKMKYDICHSGGSGIYKVNSEFQFKYELGDTAYGSFQRLTIQIKNDKTNNQWLVVPFSIVNEFRL